MGVGEEVVPSEMLEACGGLKKNYPHRIQTVVVPTFNLNTLEAEAGRSEFEASVVYISSFRHARTTQ